MLYEIINFNSGEIRRKNCKIEWIYFCGMELHCLNKLCISHTAYLPMVIEGKTIMSQTQRCVRWFLRNKICGKVFTLPKKVNLVKHRASGRDKTLKSIIGLWQGVFQWFWSKTIQGKVVTPSNKNTCRNKGFLSGDNTLKSI